MSYLVVIPFHITGEVDMSDIVEGPFESFDAAREFGECAVGEYLAHLEVGAAYYIIEESEYGIAMRKAFG